MREVTDHDFEKEVLTTPNTVAVIFWSNSCKVCKPALGVLEEVMDHFPEVVFVSANVEEVPYFATECSEAGVPNLVVFKNGAAVDSFLGYAPPETIRNFLDSVLSA